MLKYHWTLINNSLQCVTLWRWECATISTLSSKNKTSTNRVCHFLRKRETVLSCRVCVLQDSLCGLDRATLASNEASGFGFEAKMPADDLDDLCMRWCEISGGEHKHKPGSEKTQTHTEWRNERRIKRNAIHVTRSLHAVSCLVFWDSALTVTISLKVSHCAQDSNIWVLITDDYSQSSLIRADISRLFTQLWTSHSVWLWVS